MFDLLINGGEVLDGSGAPARRADVAISGERIAAIGDLSGAEARKIVSAAGCCVCPGFIDVHSHSDTFILLEPAAPSKIFQGVTTEIVGNCGASTAPRQGAYKMPTDWREKNYPGAWSSVAEYRALLEQVQPAVNIVLLIGHNSLRAGVIGYDARAATATEIRAMADLLDRALAEGGAGLSTGLIYTPGLYSTPAEVRALATVAARRGKIYTSHMRSEGDGLLEALDETLEIGRSTGIRVQVSHLKTSGRRNWAKVDAALDKIRAAAFIVDDFYDVDKLVELLVDLLENAVVAAGHNGHLRRGRVERFVDRKGFDIEPPSAEKPGNPGKHAGPVVNQY